MVKEIQGLFTGNTPAASPAAAESVSPILNFSKELIFQILMDVSPWDLVAIGETNRQLRATVKDLLTNPTFLKTFLASKVKLPARQLAPPLQTSTATNVTPPPPQMDPQIEAYKASVADAITGVGGLYLTNKQQLLHGLQALELHQMGGFVTGHNTSFVWYKNNLFVCGRNNNDQLGLGLRLGLRLFALEKVYTFTRVGGTGQPPWGDAVILGVAAGNNHTAVHTTKGLYMCGWNLFGQLGLGDNQRHNTFTRVGGTGQPPWGDAAILGVAAGNGHTAVYTTIGFYVCGCNDEGQLGLGDTQNRNKFTRVGGTGQPPWGDAAILGVAAGSAHTAVHTTKGLYVCGNNESGQLGLGHTNDCNTFTRVGGTDQAPWGDAPILGVAAGAYHTAVYTTKGLYVCGQNYYGQLGLGDIQVRNTFTRVGGTGQPPWGDAPILGVAAGGATAVYTTKGLYVCGNNGSGQLGLGPNALSRVHRFTRVGGTGQPPWGDAAILGIAAGECHTAVYTTKGLYVCGNNQYGQLGLGPNALSPVHTFTPVPFLGTMLYDAMQ